MAKGLNYGYYTYKTDSGDLYSVRLATVTGGNVALGFGARDATKPMLPRGWKMRYLMALDSASGNRRKVPVGDVAKDIWTGVETQIDLSFFGDATPVTFDVTLRVGERAHVAHPVFNI